MSNAGAAFLYTALIASVHPTSLLIGTNSAIPVVFRTNSDESMRIQSRGNVGIGTASPAARLHAKEATIGTNVFNRREPFNQEG